MMEKEHIDDISNNIEVVTAPAGQAGASVNPLEDRGGLRRCLIYKRDRLGDRRVQSAVLLHGTKHQAAIQGLAGGGEGSCAQGHLLGIQRDGLGCSSACTAAVPLLVLLA